MTPAPARAAARARLRGGLLDARRLRDDPEIRLEALDEDTSDEGIVRVDLDLAVHERDDSDAFAVAPGRVPRVHHRADRQPVHVFAVHGAQHADGPWPGASALRAIFSAWPVPAITLFVMEQEIRYLDFEGRRL